jgi:hypothetical protein
VWSLAGGSSSSTTSARPGSSDDRIAVHRMCHLVVCLGVRLLAVSVATVRADTAVLLLREALAQELELMHGHCTEHQYRRPQLYISRSIGRVEIELCNNCLSVVVVQKRDTDDVPTKTPVEMQDSAYRYVK